MKVQVDGEGVLIFLFSTKVGRNQFQVDERLINPNNWKIVFFLASD